VSQHKSSDSSGARDDLDRRIVRALRAGPRPPAPGADEPDDETLLAVLEGRASAADMAQVEASPYARERLVLLREGLAAAGPTPLAAAARYVFAVARDMLQLLRGATEPVAAPDLAWAVRSTPAAAAEPFCEFHHQWSSIDAHVRVEQIATRLDLQVRLSDAGAPVQRGRVTLRCDGRTLDSIPTDANGSAVFIGLSADAYEVEVRATGSVVGVMLLQFLPA
jgi:hypothetical protein